jgi:Cu(I)/Ag(I) efflux system membrane protein CusA/SilA
MFIETALGGMNVTTTVEGRQRFTVNVRFAQDYQGQNRQAKDDLQITNNGLWAYTIVGSCRN